MAKYGKIVALLAIVALALSVIALSGCTQPAAAPTPAPTASSTPAPAADLGLNTAGTLVVGSDTTFPPFEAMNGTTAEGFDVDMMNALGKVMGVTVVFQTENFDTIIASLQAHKFDCIASGMTITSDRQKLHQLLGPVLRLQPVGRGLEVLGHHHRDRALRQEDRRPVRHDR